MTLAIAHKDYDCRGGGEVFVRRLAEYLECPVVTGRRNLENEPDADLDIREIPLSRIEKWMIDHDGLARTLAYMMRWPAASEELREFDTVILSGNEPLWWTPHDQQTVIAYTHSTPRFMYDLLDEKTDWNSLSSRVGALFTHGERAAYESNVRRPDLWVANSELVARRMQLYWNLDESKIEVVYPPVDVGNFGPDLVPTAEHYLCLGRLVPAKRTEEVIDVWESVDAELVIAGEGPERERLEAVAPPNVTFTGFVSEQRKRELLSSARALIYPPVNEDFGMAPIEALASGTPVVGVRDGYTRYQLTDGKSGVLWERGDLLSALLRFETQGVDWSAEQLARHARRNFSVERFENQMDAVISRARARTRVDVDLSTPTRASTDDGEL